MYASTLPRSNWLRRASIRLAWYRHMPASSLVLKFYYKLPESVYAIRWCKQNISEKFNPVNKVQVATTSQTIDNRRTHLRWPTELRLKSRAESGVRVYWVEGHSPTTHIPQLHWEYRRLLHSGYISVEPLVGQVGQQCWPTWPTSGHLQCRNHVRIDVPRINNKI